MWLVLCSEHDVSALWAYQGLQVRGLQPIQLVTTEMLPHSRQWSHKLNGSGVSISITLSDGRVIDNNQIHGVLNRVTHVPLQHLTSAPDYEYATQEYTAFFMSWLHSLPQPVFNAPDAQGLCGAWRHISEWVSMAAAEGLPTAVYKQTSDDDIDESIELRRLFPPSTPRVNVIVVGSHLIGPAMPPGIREGCLQLARLAGTQLLGIELAAETAGAEWAFASATPLPDLCSGGEPLLDALALELYNSSKGSIQ